MKKVLFALLILGAACAPPPATTEKPPTEQPSTYPQSRTVSPEQLASILPKDAEGSPILLETAGGPVTLGAPRRDAISAAAKCTDLLVSCHSATKDADGCVAKLPICQTTTPWEEANACCAKACVDAYQEERRLGASKVEAYSAVFGSTHECFPGLHAAYPGKPYLAPRRAPR